jgi:hypothetical protein
MSGYLFRGYIGHEGSTTEVSMSWGVKEGQQPDKTSNMTCSPLAGLLTSQRVAGRERDDGAIISPLLQPFRTVLCLPPLLLLRGDSVIPYGGGCPPGAGVGS